MVDYGSLAVMTTDAGMLVPGLAQTASLSVPVSPGGGELSGAGEELSGAESSPGGGSAPSGGGGGSQGEVGGAAASGGDGGREAAGGGGEGGLPFTGFPAALVGAIGGALAATGAVVRRAVRRRPR